MDVYLNIICACESIPTIKQRVSSLCENVNAAVYTEELISEYWKCESCSVFIVRFRCHSSNFIFFEGELFNISGGHHVEVKRNELHAEMFCFTTIPELLSIPCSAFVSCYITFN